MSRVLCVAVLISLFVFSGTGVAQIVEKSSDLSVHAGILKIENGDAELTFGARYSYNFDAKNSLEGSIGFVFPEKSKIYLYHVNYRYNMVLENEMFVPFVTGGIGFVTQSPENFDSSTDFSFNFGGGMMYFVNEKTAVRVDVRDILIKGEHDTTNNISFTGGVSFFFI